MNLLSFDEKNRESFSNIVKTLVVRHEQSPQEIFMHALESEAEPEMNYWMTMVLVQEQFVSANLVVSKDAAGEAVKAFHAACLLKNVGMVAALLELSGFKGTVMDKEFQLAARIAAKQEDQVVMGVLMKYAQEKDLIEPFMRSLQGSLLQ